jgi:hypothetical protein
VSADPIPRLRLHAHRRPTAPRPALRLTTGRISCVAARSFDAIAPLAAEWDAVVADAGAPFELTHGWCRAWWAHHGGERDLRLFVFRAADEIVGVVPMTIGRVAVGPLHVRMARTLGTEGRHGAGDLPVRPGWEEAVADELLLRLALDERCEAIRVGPLADPSALLDALRGAAERRADLLCLARDRAAAPRVSLTLPPAPGAFVTDLPRKARALVRRAWAELHNDHDGTVDIRHGGPEVDDAARDLDPLHRGLVERLAPAQRVRLLRLRADGQDVVRLLAFVHGQRAMCDHAAIGTRAPLGAEDLVRLALARLAEGLAAEGVRTLALGPGLQPAARRLGARTRASRSLLIADAAPAIRARARLLALAGDGLDAACRRVFARGLRRPEWVVRTWERTRW